MKGTFIKKFNIYWLVGEVSKYLGNGPTLINQDSDNEEVSIYWSDDGEYTVKVITSITLDRCRLEILKLPEKLMYHLIGYCQYHEIDWTAP
jgi:hypothetical protein